MQRLPVSTALRSATLAVLFAAASARAGAQDAAAVFARHLASVGGKEGLEAAGAFEVVGTLEEGPHRSGLRFVTRRSPFGFREEVRALTMPQPVRVVATDGARAWMVDPTGTGQRLPPESEKSFLDRAFLEAMAYLDLDPGRFRLVPEEAGPLPRRGVPAGEGFEEGIEVVALAVAGPSGREWHLLVDPETGTLHERHAHDGEGLQWVRLGAWQRIGALSVATRGYDGATQVPGNALFRVEHVHPRLELPDPFFEPLEAAPKPTLVAASPLARAAAPLPDSFYLFVPEVRLDGHGPFPALLDTAADRTAVEPSLAAGLRLPFLQAGSVGTAFGRAPTSNHWVRALTVGSQTFAGIAVQATSLFPFPELPSGFDPKVLLGADLLHAGSPVLDLRGERLHLRGTPVKPLATLLREAAFGPEGAGARVVEIPLRPPESGSGSFAIEGRLGGRPIECLLDTGFPAHVRLSKDALRALGLPAEADGWPGAIPYGLQGAGGGRGVDLVARLPSFSVGPIELTRPYVHLAGLGGASAEVEHEGLLGSAFFAPFPRVGFDASRSVLELELPEGVEPDAAGAVRLPAPGEFVGIRLERPALSFGPEPEVFPRVSRVYAGTPAEKAGVREGDYLVEIDGASARGQAPAVLHSRLWPREGETVRLRLRRAAGDGEYGATLP